jgi:alpha-tubulin suppressor-like RCC1 family protein
MLNIDCCLMLSFLFADRGIVYGCGDNKFGQCGVGHQNPTILTATAVSEIYSFVFVSCFVPL